jgi:hypothetical protein
MGHFGNPRPFPDVFWKKGSDPYTDSKIRTYLGTIGDTRELSVRQEAATGNAKLI